MMLSSPVPLSREHSTALFDCGVPPLNEYLHKYALQNNLNRSSRTYVAMRGERVAGFYTLANGSVNPDQAPPRVGKGLGKYPIPITLLARLAVDVSEKGRGLGQSLLKDAVLRAYQASEIVGSRAIVTHAKDVAAKSFYERFQFAPSPVNEFHVFLLMKDVKQIFAAS